MPINLGKKKQQQQPQPQTQAKNETLSEEQLQNMRPQTSLRPGSVVGATNLTESERKLLEQVGWRPGEAIPADISKQLKGLQIVGDVREFQKRLQAEAEDALPLPPDTPPLKMPKPRLLEDLPPEHRKKVAESIRKALADAQDMAKAAQGNQSVKQPQFTDQSIAQAAQQVLQHSPGVDVYAGAKPAWQPQTVDESELQHPYHHVAASQKAEQKAPDPEPQGPDEAKKFYEQVKKDLNKDHQPGTGVESKSRNCQHCGWDLAKPEPAEDPTYEDKLGFLQSVMGQIRFKKYYELFDGKIVLTFRTLSTEESDLAMTQTAVDMSRLMRVDDEHMFMRTLSDYRLCLSLDSLYVENRGKVYSAPEDIWTGFEVPDEDKPKEDTILPLIVKYIYGNVLTHDSIRRMVGVNFFNFSRMVELMEARVLDSDFWKATGGPR